MDEGEMGAHGGPFAAEFLNDACHSPCRAWGNFHLSADPTRGHAGGLLIGHCSKESHRGAGRQPSGEFGCARIVLVLG
jgi:hypothetical protein